MSMSGKDKKLLYEVRDVVGLNYYSIHAERTCCDWIKRYTQYHTMARREEELINGKAKIKVFLTHLAVYKEVSLPSQN